MTGASESGELWRLGLAELAASYARGRTDPIAVTEACLARIERVDPEVNAFVDVDADGARAAARRSRDELAAGRVRGPLHGVPIAIKELFDVAGLPAEYGSLIRRGIRAERDAVVVARLREAGAVVVGTTRSHEFGWGITTQHAGRGSTRNPWALDRVPGGSSGGSAAAVAAGMVPAAIASDTGGSIRIPSAFCGVAGIKPTFGRIARSGGVALAPSLDTVGVIARVATDLWPVLQAVSGPDPGDPASVVADLAPLSAPPPTTLAGRRIGYPPGLFEYSKPTDRLARFREILDRAASCGADLVELDLPAPAEFLSAFGPTQMAEAYDVHARQLGLYPQRQGDYGADVAGRLAAASRVSVGDYLGAARSRLALVAALTQAVADVDVLLSPISTVGPPFSGEPDTARFEDGDSLPLRDAVMGCTVPQNLAGLPSVAIRAGLAADGLPFGVQVTAARGREDLALALGAALEAELVPSEPAIPTALRDYEQATS